jgi:PAS domain S-box-containing protein
LVRLPKLRQPTGLKPLRVLIVEDSEDDALLLLGEFRRNDYEPIHKRVDTPEAMQEALASSEWDVIISDYRMPRFGALEALAMFREGGSEVPFIVVSGKVGEAAAVEVMKAGAYDFLTKDNLVLLSPTVERGLEETRERRRRDAILKALRFAAERFLGEVGGWEESIQEILRRLGEAAKVSRVYIFENYSGDDGEVWATQRYEWVAQGISAQIDNPRLKALPYRAAGFGRWEELLSQGDLVYGHTRDFPQSERPELQAQDILSIVIVPILVEGAWWGFVGFDECLAEREWFAVEMDALKAAASTLGAALRRRRGEEALRESEERFRATFEQAAVGVAHVDLDGRWLRVNNKLCEITGYPREELVGMSFQDITHPDDLHKDLNYLHRSLAGEIRTYSMEKRYFRKDGSVVWINLTVSAVGDTSGQPRYFISVMEDITERKKAQEALSQSERLYRTVIEQATENIYLVDVETRRIVESNSAFRTALGYTEEELRGMTLYDVVAHDPESIDRNVRRTLQEGRSSMGQREYRRKDGSLLEVEASGSIIFRNGRETICVVAHDVTERARAQRLLEERVATLSRIAANLAFDLPTEDTLNVLAESAVNASTAVACAVVLVDSKDDTLHLFGSYGLPEGYTAGLQEAYRAGAPSPSLQAFRTREPVLVRDLRRFLLEDPRYAPVHRFVREVPWDIVYSLPLVSRDRAVGAIFFCYLPGEEPGEEEKVFLKAVADQTAVAIENARLFAEARGKAALEERQRLARELHDSVSQALYGIALGTKTARTLVKRNPDQAADPLDYVLSLAEAGLAEMRALIFELRPESLETEGLVAALEKQAAALRARHEIAVETSLCDEPEASPEVKEAVYRIAQEALHNTVKHARASHGQVRMTCASELITLEVSDDGVGFDPEEDFPGHLGLRSMRERAQRLGGTLKVEATLGSGTTIHAHIPTHRSDALMSGAGALPRGTEPDGG